MNNISNEEVWPPLEIMMPQNISSDHDEEEVLRRLETVVPILVPIIFSIIILIGGVGNILVVLVVVVNKSMRSTTNLLILNLAVKTDMLLSVFAVFDVFLMLVEMLSLKCF